MNELDHTLLFAQVLGPTLFGHQIPNLRFARTRRLNTP